MTSLFTTPTDRLATYFDSSAREAYEDTKIDEIANLLERCAHIGSKCPRTYIVLRIIGELDVLEQMVNEGFTDQWFPVEPRGLPSFLSPSIKSKFVQSQNAVLTKSLDLENGKHRHFAPDEALPFEILGRLGTGGYSQVDKITSKISFRQYALKRIRRRAAFGQKSKEAMNQFMTEIRIMRDIKHKHIVEYIGSYTDRAYLGLVMSPIADVDLNGFMELTCARLRATSAISPELSTLINHDQVHAAQMCTQLRTFFGCLAAALAYLHDESIRHKDIKPQNILVHRSNVLFTDFGISRDFRDGARSTTSGLTPASPRYSPPEVAAYGARNTSADIWALGCVFLEMVAVLHSHNVEWVKQYFVAIHTTSPHFHANPEATSQLISELETTGNAIDRKPLQLIRRMVRLDRTSRLNAAEVFEFVSSSDDQEHNSSTFCGICCTPDVEIDSDDSLVDDVTTLVAASPMSANSSTNLRLKHETPEGSFVEQSRSTVKSVSGHKKTGKARSRNGKEASQRSTSNKKGSLFGYLFQSRAKTKGEDKHSKHRTLEEMEAEAERRKRHQARRAEIDWNSVEEIAGLQDWDEEEVRRQERREQRRAARQAEEERLKLEAVKDEARRAEKERIASEETARLQEEDEVRRQERREQRRATRKTEEEELAREEKKRRIRHERYRMEHAALNWHKALKEARRVVSEEVRREESEKAVERGEVIFPFPTTSRANRHKAEKEARRVESEKADQAERDEEEAILPFPPTATSNQQDIVHLSYPITEGRSTLKRQLGGYKSFQY